MRKLELFPAGEFPAESQIGIKENHEAFISDRSEIMFWLLDARALPGMSVKKRRAP